MIRTGEQRRELMREYVRAHRNREFVGSTLQVRSKPLAQIAHELQMTRAQARDAMLHCGFFEAATDAEKAEASPEGRKAMHQLNRTTAPRTRAKFDPYGWDEE